MSPASAARQAANRQNARLSTGPKTAAGKARSAANRLSHGLCSQALLLEGESAADLAALRNETFAAFAPVSAQERLLANDLVEAQWRLRRARLVENAATQVLIERERRRFKGTSGLTGAEALAYLLIYVDRSELSRLQRYVGTHERAYQRALRNLQMTQAARRRSAPAPTAKRTTEPMTEPAIEPTSNPAPRVYAAAAASFEPLRT